MVLKEIFRNKKRIYYNDGKYYKYRDIRIKTLSRLYPASAKMVINVLLKKIK